MTIFFKSKWFFMFLFGIGLLAITIFYKAEDNAVKENKHQAIIKQNAISTKPLSISEIDSNKLPPEAKPLFDSLAKLQSAKTSKFKPELENRVKEADALIAKTDQLFAKQGLPVGIPVFKKELSEKSEVENKIDELQAQLSSLKEENSNSK